MTAEMKREIGVHRRSDSTIWQWSIRTPKDLRHQYGPTWACRCSLETSDLKTANLRASVLRAHWLSEFERQRLQRPAAQKVERITPEVARFLANQMLHETLSHDEATRTDPSQQEWLLRWMRGMEMEGANVVPDRLSGMPEALAEMLTSLHLEHDKSAGLALSRGMLIKALPGMQHVARQIGVIFDENTPGAIEALREYLRAVKTATSLQVQRDNGQVVDTPSAPSLVAIENEKVHTLRDVFAEWKKSKKRGTDSIGSTERALSMYEEQTGNPDLAKLTRPQGTAFRAWLLTQKLASKTMHDRITQVKSLLNFARRDLLWLSSNPWEGLDIEHATETKRRPWTTEELSAFFSLPLFATYALPRKTWRAGGAAAYWIPVLGLFTGARIGELCQLCVQDIKTENAAVLISINGETEGSTVKTQAGWRDVPLHSQLIALGFLEYVEATKQAGHTQLWPDLRKREGKPGAYFSSWFSEARKLTPISVPDFHSLRHTVRTKMTEAGISEAIQDRITGHEVRGSTGTRVYAHPVNILRQAIESITYPGLALPKVYH
jgi:integrase